MATNEQTMDETSGPTAAALTPESFDLAAWVDGIQPVTHSVTLYARGDLVGDMDRIHARLRHARDTRDTRAVEELTAQAREVVDILNESALDVVVVGWSQDRIDAFRRERAEEGLDEHAVSLAQVAAQVIQPEGFTVSFLETLFERIGPQAQQIVAAVSAANSQAPKVTVPF